MARTPTRKKPVAGGRAKAPAAHPALVTLNCPNQVTWSNDVKQLFTATDVAWMKSTKNIDLSDYNSTKASAYQIFNAVSATPQYMPPPRSGEAQWTDVMINTFGCWIKQNFPE